MNKAFGVYACGLALAVAAAWAATAQGAVKPANDVAVKMKVTDPATVGPLCRITVKNQGTAAQNDVSVRIFAESENGLELWSGTVDVLPGKSATVSQRVYLDTTTTCLVAVAALSGAADEHPADDRARVGIGLKGKPAQVLVGKAIYDAFCASCHADTSFFAGKTPAQLLAGANDPPKGTGITFGAADVKVFRLFLKNAANVQMPPDLPTPPEGGWPTFAGDVLPLLEAHCTNCHGPSLASGKVRLDTYAATVKQASRAKADVASGKMPQGGSLETSVRQAFVQTLNDWITGGKRP